MKRKETRALKLGCAGIVNAETNRKLRISPFTVSTYAKPTERECGRQPRLYPHPLVLTRLSAEEQENVLGLSMELLSLAQAILVTAG